MSETTVIEINGVKMEIDLRHAKQVYENLRIGSRVKVFDKDYNSSQIFHGVIVGFENFTEMPTIVVCALARKYGDYKMEFFYVNNKSNIQLVPAIDWYPEVEKEDVITFLDKQINEAKAKIEDIEAKKKFFLDNFNACFEKA